MLTSLSLVEVIGIVMLWGAAAIGVLFGLFMVTSVPPSPYDFLIALAVGAAAVIAGALQIFV